MSFIRDAYAKIRAAYLKGKAKSLLLEAASLQARAAAMQAKAAALLGEEAPPPPDLIMSASTLSNAPEEEPEAKPKVWTPPENCKDCKHWRSGYRCDAPLSYSCKNAQQARALGAERAEQLRRAREERERAKRDDFIQKTYLFLGMHGTRKADIEALLDFMKKKCGLDFNTLHVRWTADQDSISCFASWSSHSFFDDGGGIEGEKRLSVTYVGLEEEGFCIENEKLEDPTQLYDGNSGELFYVKDPFGFRGVFEVKGYYYTRSTD